MNLDAVKARGFGSNTIATKDEDGFWKVITEMVEKISFDGENFEEKKIESMGIDKDFQKAFDTALVAILNDYQDQTGGRGTLFTALLADDKPKTNKDTKA